MTDVSIYLKSKRKPIRFTLETARQKASLLVAIETDRFVNVGHVTINCDDISYICFEDAK